MGGERKKKIEGKYSKVPSGKYPISSLLVMAKQRVRPISKKQGYPAAASSTSNTPSLIVFSDG